MLDIVFLTMPYNKIIRLNIKLNRYHDDDLYAFYDFQLTKLFSKAISLNCFDLLLYNLCEKNRVIYIIVS